MALDLHLTKLLKGIKEISPTAFVSYNNTQCSWICQTSCIILILGIQQGRHSKGIKIFTEILICAHHELDLEIKGTAKNNTDRGFVIMKLMFSEGKQYKY